MSRLIREYKGYKIKLESAYNYEVIKPSWSDHEPIMECGTMAQCIDFIEGDLPIRAYKLMRLKNNEKQGGCEIMNNIYIKYHGIGLRLTHIEHDGDILYFWYNDKVITIAIDTNVNITYTMTIENTRYFTMTDNK